MADEQEMSSTEALQAAEQVDHWARGLRHVARLARFVALGEQSANELEDRLKTLRQFIDKMKTGKATLELEIAALMESWREKGEKLEADYKQRSDEMNATYEVGKRDLEAGIEALKKDYQALEADLSSKRRSLKDEITQLEAVLKGLKVERDATVARIQQALGAG